MYWGLATTAFGLAVLFSSAQGQYLTVCETIASSISPASEVFYAGTLQYIADNYHWASSSSQTSACSVEPGTNEDVGIILGILGENETPFAVKGGGHASNPGYSSTPGVHIALSRFSAVTYDASSSTAEIGMGLIWDDVYGSLESYDVNVVGGRVTGVGVAGFTLGGGYSWLSNQYGLTIDTVQVFDLVLPNGTFVAVSESNYPDLFFGLKGGFNNFGIVTQITLTTYPQTQVWGGLITFTEDVIPQVNNATVEFAATNTDPKAAIITTYNFVAGEIGVSQLLFYDAPTPPDGLFDDFLNIPYFTKDISTRSFVSLVQSSLANSTAGTRGVFNTVSVLEYPLGLIEAIANQTNYWGTNGELQGGVFISYDVEPFLSSVFSHGIASAYPPDRSRGLLPLNLYYAWTSELSDAYFQDAIVESAQTIYNVAVSEGQDIADAALYGNYAIAGTPLDKIYGDNVATLQALKETYDPSNVMGLAGGWKF